MTPPTTQTAPSSPTWHRVHDPDDTPDRARFITWGKVPLGTELTGIWRGALQGKYGEYGVVELSTGAKQPFGLPTLLARRLSLVEPGQEIRITYMGTAGGTGDKSPYHTFEVATRVPIAPGDEEVPF